MTRPESGCAGEREEDGERKGCWTSEGGGCCCAGRPKVRAGGVGRGAERIAMEELGTLRLDRWPLVSCPRKRERGQVALVPFSWHHRYLLL